MLVFVWLPVMDVQPPPTPLLTSPGSLRWPPCWGVVVRRTSPPPACKANPPHCLVPSDLWWKLPAFTHIRTRSVIGKDMIIHVVIKGSFKSSVSILTAFFFFFALYDQRSVGVLNLWFLTVIGDKPFVRYSGSTAFKKFSSSLMQNLRSQNHLHHNDCCGIIYNLRRDQIQTRKQLAATNRGDTNHSSRSCYPSFFSNKYKSDCSACPIFFLK